MSESRLQQENDGEFEKKLSENISFLPPDDRTMSKITPFKKAMNRILAGIALTGIVINFLCLDYILPFIGIVLSVLGFRALRKENRWFYTCFILNIIKLVHFSVYIALNATIFSCSDKVYLISEIVNSAAAFIIIPHAFCFWQGLRAVNKKAGANSGTAAGAVLTLWSVILYVLQIIRYTGLIIPVVMLIILAAVFIILRKISKDMNEEGFSLTPSAVKISDVKIISAAVSVVLVFVFLGYAFFGSYPMEWQAAAGQSYADTDEIKIQLIELGFPENVLNDLTAEEIKQCAGASKIVSESNDHPVNDGRTQVTYQANQVLTETVYDSNELRITSVGVLVPGEREKWIIFHHFQWTEDPGFCGTESIQILPAYIRADSGMISDRKISGRVLYDSDGKTFESPFYSLEEETYSYSSIIYGKYSETAVFGTFSMTEKGENYRGYVYYTAESGGLCSYFDSRINYTHQKSIFQYPVMTAKKNRMTYGINHSGVFVTVNDALMINI